MTRFRKSFFHSYRSTNRCSLPVPTPTTIGSQPSQFSLLSADCAGTTDRLMRFANEAGGERRFSIRHCQQEYYRNKRQGQTLLSQSPAGNLQASRS